MSPFLRRKQRAAERIAILGADDGGLQGRQFRRERDELSEMIDGVDDERRQIARFGDLGDARRVDLGGSLADHVAVDVFDLRVEHRDRLFALLAAGHRDLDLVADVNAAQEAQVLRAIERSRTGKQIAEHGGDERADPHRGRDRLGLLRRALGRGQHQRIEVARNMGEQEEILHRAASLEAGRISNLELGPGLVADRGFGAHVGPYACPGDQSAGGRLRPSQLRPSSRAYVRVRNCAMHNLSSRHDSSVKSAPSPRRKSCRARARRMDAFGFEGSGSPARAEYSLGHSS